MHLLLLHFVTLNSFQGLPKVISRLKQVQHDTLSDSLVLNHNYFSSVRQEERKRAMTRKRVEHMFTLCKTTRNNKLLQFSEEPCGRDRRASKLKIYPLP
jgi:hypothetical protein